MTTPVTRPYTVTARIDTTDASAPACADAVQLPPAFRLAAALQKLMTEYPTDDAQHSADAVAAVLTVTPLHGPGQETAIDVPLQAGQVEWLTSLVGKESDRCRNSHSDQSGQCGHCGGTSAARRA